MNPVKCLFALLFAVVIAACGSDAQIEAEADTGTEESGEMLALDATYDMVRNDARLVLSYDPALSSFVGSVENTAEQTLCRVRVEVHLSNGTELGPTTPIDLEPGEQSDVSLPAAEETFDGWTAHPEVSSCDGEGSGEHEGEGEEGSGEHDEEGEEGSGEHDEEGEEGSGEHG
jgi:hypothetical protein